MSGICTLVQYLTHNSSSVLMTFLNPIPQELNLKSCFSLSNYQEHMICSLFNLYLWVFLLATCPFLNLTMWEALMWHIYSIYLYILINIQVRYIWITRFHVLDLFSLEWSAFSVNYEIFKPNHTKGQIYSGNFLKTVMFSKAFYLL